MTTLQKPLKEYMMGGNYEKGMYNQLMEVMARLDSVEKNYKKDVRSLNDRIDELTQENDALRKENRLLKNDNARLRSIINNDSSNTSLPLSTDQKDGKPANTAPYLRAEPQCGTIYIILSSLQA